MPRSLAAAAAIAAAIALIYARSTSAYFLDDDFHWLVQTQSFDPANMLDLSRYDHFYRPVIETWFFSGLFLFGCSPFPFHLASVGAHLVTTSLVYLFARSTSPGSSVAWTYAVLSALFFAVQPGLTDAVTWIGAITDLLPVPFFVLALLLHLRFLQTGRRTWYAATVVAFIMCHLTHESAATLLPMMLLVELTFATGGALTDRLQLIARHWARYTPFAALLLGYLAVAVVVNTRSYLVRDGYYAPGLHAIPNIVHYVIWLYVGKRALVDYVATVGALAAIAMFGTPRMRFSLAWIVLTLLPVSFFTWGGAPRYLYLPAVGFAMLVADLMMGLHAWAGRRTTPSTARILTTAIVVALAVRFGAFAKSAADAFPAKTAAYARFAEQLRRTNPDARAGATVVIDASFLEGVPDLYREPAARVGLCLPDLRLHVR